MLQQTTIKTGTGTAPEAHATQAGAELILPRVLLSNLPFIVALGYGTHMPEALKPLVVGTSMFLAPGLAWTDHRNADAAVVLFRALTRAILASLLTLLIVMWPEGPTSRTAFVLLLAAITNVGLWLGFRRGWYEARPFATPLARGLTLLAALFFAQSYAGAAHFIPPLEDQDMELQGTAYGLMNALTPTMTTNDSRQYYFAHPLLLHFLIGESALIAGDLEQLRYYYDGALALGPPPSGPSAEAWEAVAFAQWERDYEHFMREPHRVATRTPNMWLAALSLFPLGLLAYRLSGRVAAALVACVVYATLPEVYVRSAYGGYMALANLLTLFGCYFYLSQAGLLPARELAPQAVGPAQRSTFIAAFLSGWTDQKNLILLLASWSHAGLRRLREGELPSLLRGLSQRADVRAAATVTLGLLSGWATYVVYGLCAAPHEFFEHHIREHILDRLAMNDVNLSQVAKGDWTYPSIVALWQQFAEHSGWLVVGVGVLALAHAAQRFRSAQGVLALWVVLAGIGFSLVDWRQTKHLAQFLPALAVLIGVYWAACAGRAKLVCSGALALAVAWNLWRIGMLMHDFEYLKPLPIW